MSGQLENQNQKVCKSIFLFSEKKIILKIKQDIKHYKQKNKQIMIKNDALSDVTLNESVISVS